MVSFSFEKFKEIVKRSVAWNSIPRHAKRPGADRREALLARATSDPYSVWAGLRFYTRGDFTICEIVDGFKLVNVGVAKLNRSAGDSWADEAGRSVALRRALRIFA